MDAGTVSLRPSKVLSPRISSRLAGGLTASRPGLRESRDKEMTEEQVLEAELAQLDKQNRYLENQVKRSRGRLDSLKGQNTLIRQNGGVKRPRDKEAEKRDTTSSDPNSSPGPPPKRRMLSSVVAIASSSSSSSNKSKEEQEDKPKRLSSVIGSAVPAATPGERPRPRVDTRKERGRNSRMFGALLMGTLKRFKKEQETKTEADKKREQLDEEIISRVTQEKQEDLKEKQEELEKSLDTATKEREDLLKQRQEKELKLLNLRWKRYHQSIRKWRKTKTTPSLLWSPKGFETKREEIQLPKPEDEEEEKEEMQIDEKKEEEDKQEEKTQQQDKQQQEEQEQEQEEEEEQDKQEEEIDLENLNKLKLVELRQYCKNHGIKVKGRRKAIFVEAILKYHTKE